ncbi:hypothetical protein AMAG_17104 [Allomyces macrogynus ATCC 38327]|uniref:Uncharacterized protein n=1 Tax=Allomyces macrogynus (strain ATCC 38327) TaxID=578462 RepID=A0A0L0TDM1_ALLM3|nr:hypothetical protein AMAG_17104 [Allomyces macrogynus ATCC 38327]|eukprot:KNE72776.1 hypothetical protein AMAG_17104 [Allomyces macrogynus ATCC 38327]
MAPTTTTSSTAAAADPTLPSAPAVPEDPATRRHRDMQRLAAMTRDIFRALIHHLRGLADNLESNALHVWAELDDELRIEMPPPAPVPTKPVAAVAVEPQVDAAEPMDVENDAPPALSPRAATAMPDPVDLDGDDDDVPVPPPAMSTPARTETHKRGRYDSRDMITSPGSALTRLTC